MRKIFLFVLLLQSTSLLAQPYIDIARFQFGNFGVSDLYKGKNEWRVKNEWSHAAINVPIKIGKRDILMISPQYDQKYFYDNASSQLINNGSVTIDGTLKYEATYQSIAIPLTYRHTLSDTTKSIVFFYSYHQNWSNKINPGWTTDQHGGALIYNKRSSAKFIWKAGIYYNREFYGNYIVPLIGFEWKPNNKIFMWALLRNNATFDYTLSNPFHVGIAYRGFEESYAEGYNDYFHLREGQIELFGNYYIPHTPLVISLSAGQTVARKYEYNVSSNNGDAITKTHPTEGFFVRGGVALRVVRDQKFKTRRLKIDGSL